MCHYYNHSNCEIKLLAYPLIQTILGVIRLNLVDTFYLLRLYLVNLLNLISEKTNIYIPIAVYIIEVLESTHFKSHFKLKNLNSEIDININIKLKKDELKEFSTNSYIIEQALDSLLEFLAINRGKVSYPDICYGVTNQLRKIYKTVIEKSFKDYFKTFFEKVQANSDQVEQNRSAMNFSVLSRQKCTNFEGKILIS